MKKIILLISITTVLLIAAGCSTPQERSGVSPIPFNSPPQDDNRTMNGSF